MNPPAKPWTPNPRRLVPSPPARVALVGAGKIAEDHCEAISTTTGLALVRVVDRHAERARALGARYGAGFSTDVASLYTNEVDAVVICTTPDSHAALAVQAVTSGKAVLVEKPVALDLAAAERLLDTAAAEGQVVLVGQTARFQPAHLEVAAAVAGGGVGRPRLLHLSWYTGHRWPAGWRGWQMDPTRSGGHVLHNGIHALDLATWLLQDTPATVFARPLRTWAADMPTPDTFHVVVSFTGGSKAVIEVSYALRSPGILRRRLYLAGTEGSALVSVESSPGPADDRLFPPAGIEEAMRLQYAHFRDVLLEGKHPVTASWEVRAALAGAVAAQRSADSGLPVTVEAVA